MNPRNLGRVLMILGAGVALYLGSSVGRWATAQSPASETPPTAEEGAPKGDFQRSAEIYNFKWAAQSGPQRGEEIYFYKCWICHNEYAKSAPFLKDLYQRPRLVSGEPVNDRTVSAKILNGAEGMPAYRYSFSDADLEDILSYLREGKCCFDSENSPPNPRYRNP